MELPKWLTATSGGMKSCKTRQNQHDSCFGRMIGEVMQRSSYALLGGIYHLNKDVDLDLGYRRSLQSGPVRIPANVTDDSGDRDRCWCCAM